MSKIKIYSESRNQTELVRLPWNDRFSPGEIITVGDINIKCLGHNAVGLPILVTIGADKEIIDNDRWVVTGSQE